MKTFALFLLLGGFSFGQQAGSKAAYRMLYEREREQAEAEADWNKAKKLSAKVVEPNSYKDTKQDFGSLELLNGAGFSQQWPFKVYSVIDPSNVVLKFDGVLFWIEGASTNGLRIGDSVRILNPIKFETPKTYEGNPIKYAKTMSGEEFSDLQKKIARDKRKEKSQVFEFSDTKTIEAVFIDVRKGKAVLEDLDGNTTEHALTEFSPKSASTIRELFKKKPKPQNTPK
jgi:hypothetical protein